MGFPLGHFKGKPHPKDLTLHRTLKIPQQLVFEAFTQPEHLRHWWAPKPFTVPYCEVDLRVGGVWRYSMRAPDGWEHRCDSVYQEIVPPRKLVMVSAVMGEGGRKLFEIEQTLFLEGTQEGTKLELKAKVLYAGEGCEPYLSGMEQGTNMTLDNLVEHLGKGGAA